MTFAAPLFLLAALAAAIPVVLHMMNRQKAKELPFSTLRFLRISVQKTRRRKRIHDVLLMVLRAAVLLLIAAGLARPALTSLGALWGGSQSAVVVILDNSASMGMIDPDRPRLETAAAAAIQIFDQLGEGDEVALCPTCGPTFPDADKLHRTQDAVRQILAQCRVSYERADLGTEIEHARNLLAKSEAPNKQIYVLTDMQKISWDRLKGEKKENPSAESPHPNPLPKGEGTNKDLLPKEAGTGANPSTPNPQSPIPVVIVDCNRQPKPNVALVGVDVEAAMPVAGLPVKATVTLLNTSTVPQQPRVELLVDGNKESSSPEVKVLPQGQAKQEFVFTCQRGGLHRGEVRLVGEDGSKYDDRRFFTVEIDQGIPVAIVRAKRQEIAYLDDTYYLERALAPSRGGGAAIQTTMLAAGDLMSESLDKYKVIFCVNLPAPNADAAERLRAYAARGGCVVWVCGDNVDADAYNQMNQQAHGQLLPATLAGIRTPGPKDNRDSWHINFLDKTFPALSHLVEPAALYESVLVYKHARMTAEPATHVLARLDDGEPLLALRNVERGKVLLLGVSVHVNWSNLPLRPIFLPLITRLTFELAEVRHNSHNAMASQPLVLPFPNATGPVGVELIPPSGETLRLKSEGTEGKVGQTFRYADTHAIGVYLLRVLGTTRPEQISYAVNADSDEADPQKIDRKDLQERFGPLPVVFAENPDDLSATFALLREGKSLWGVFLALVLVGLVFETFLSNRLSPKQEAETTQQPPPGMRRLAKKAG
jgi:hypothetical protein